MSPTTLAFLALFALGCTLAVTRHPIYGLMTYVGVFYVEPNSAWWAPDWFASMRWVFLAAGVTLFSMMRHKPLSKTAELSKYGIVKGLVVFVAWIVIQSLWALDPDSHFELVTMWIKFLVVLFMICRCIDSEEHLKYFLWTHVAGCFYLGWIAYTSYQGGRFEGFGASGLAEANAGALQLVTGVLVGGALFLASTWRGKAVLLVLVPFIVNGMVTTVSRSGFLAAAAGGLAFNLLTPGRYKGRVIALSAIAAMAFMFVANASYWQRIDTIKLKGADIEGVDTGGGRLEIIAAQWKMFQEHEMGCGHMCTTVLSPFFMEKRLLAEGGKSGRASHNTVMTMLVDHGIPGFILYVSMQLWIFSKIFMLFRRLRGSDSFLATILPGIAAVLAAIAVGDEFVQYPKLEARVWFIGLLIVLIHQSELLLATARKPVARVASDPNVPDRRLQNERP